MLLATSICNRLSASITKGLSGSTSLHISLAEDNPTRSGKTKNIRMIKGNPKTGIPYKLFLSSKASKEKPNRLIIFLPPLCSNCMDDTAMKSVKSLAPKFISKGFALFMVPQREPDGWNPKEMVNSPANPDTQPVRAGLRERPVLKRERWLLPETVTQP